MRQPPNNVHRISRRLFLSELGRGTVAIAVLGTTVVACGNDGTENSASSATTATTGGSAGTANQVTTTTAPAESTTTAVSDEAPAPTTGLRWERASFGFVSAYVVARGNEVAIVDTGTAGNLSPIEDALSALTLDWSNVNHVVLTHLHGDHTGGLPAVLGSTADAAAYAGSADVSGIDSPRTLVALNDGDDVLGMEVIATPGHTPGSISLLDSEAGLLIAGDALTVDGQGMLSAPSEQFTPDMDLAAESLRSLAARDYATVLVGHGNPYENQDAPAATEAIANAIG